MSPERPATSNGSSKPRAASIVLHLLPYDQPRGAQLYARSLVDHLGSFGERHMILTMFKGEGRTLDADVAMDVPRGFMRRLGLDPRAVVGLRRLLRDLEPELVVAHGGESAKYASLALHQNTLLVYVSIGSAHLRANRRRSSLMRKHYLKRADAVVAVSKGLAEEVVRRDRVPADKVVVIPNGRDTSVYRPRGADSAAATTRLIWVGQLDVTKRPELFIELVEVLVAEGFRVEADMVGDGPRRSELASMAAGAEVSLLGRRSDVPDLLASSDIFVFTGRPPEGMPGVLIEAGLSGIATVTTRVPGADEVISEGMTGILVEIDDKEGLIAAVRHLVVDVDARREMGRKARARCAEMFSVDKTVGLWRELFARLLSS